MDFRKAIVVNPPSPPGYVSNKDSMSGFGQLFPMGATLFPPLDMVYLASYLAEKKVPVDVLECLGLELTKEQLVEEIASACDVGSNGSVLIVVRTSAPTLDWDLSICSEIKAKTDGARIGIYGPVVPHVIGRIQQESSLDYIVRGDPDEVVYELMLGRSEGEIRGLTFREGGWIENPSRAPIKDLDTLPFPKWELLPYKKYTLPKSSARSEAPFLPMLTSRGCPIGCHYCPYPVGQGLAWRFRSPQNVADEIEHLVRDLGIRYILFRDPMFSLRPKRVIDICQEIGRRGLECEWRCETRIDFLNEETLRAMARAGCSGVNFGVESADVEIQANVGRKPIAKERFVDTVTLCRQLGINTFAFFIIGLPGDTVQTILKTIEFAIDLQPDWIQFTAASPFIGTQLREWAFSRGLVTEDEYAYVSSHEVTMGNENLSKEQVQSFLHFAQFLQKYLINRKGILKADNRPGWIYQVAKSQADIVSEHVARAIFALGKRHFTRRFRTVARGST